MGGVRVEPVYGLKLRCQFQKWAWGLSEDKRKSEFDRIISCGGTVVSVRGIFVVSFAGTRHDGAGDVIQQLLLTDEPKTLLRLGV